MPIYSACTIETAVAFCKRVSGHTVVDILGTTVLVAFAPARGSKRTFVCLYPTQEDANRAKAFAIDQLGLAPDQESK